MDESSIIDIATSEIFTFISFIPPYFYFCILLQMIDVSIYIKLHINQSLKKTNEKTLYFVGGLALCITIIGIPKICPC